MENFEHRERGFESAFAHDEQLAFRVRMSALRKLGRWAGETLHSQTPDADAEALVARALQGADDETLLIDLARDLISAHISAHRVRSRFAAFMQEAAREVQR